jgi:hypothetical protein
MLPLRNLDCQRNLISYETEPYRWWEIFHMLSFIQEPDTLGVAVLCPLIKDPNKISQLLCISDA